MKAIIQRVKKSRVLIDGNVNGVIGKGLNVLLGIGEGDNEKDARYLADKIMKLRIFADHNDKMNLSLQDINGEIIVISQFTLYGDCTKGNRPSFTKSAPPDKAEKLYEYFIEYIETKYDIDVKTGQFGEMMDVYIENDGPVTLIIESPEGRL